MQGWILDCRDTNEKRARFNFCRRSINTVPSHPVTGAKKLPPTGLAYMYIESSGNNQRADDNSLCASFSRYDLNNISNISFYYNRYSRDGSENEMASFVIKKLDVKIIWFLFSVYKKCDEYTLIDGWKSIDLDITTMNYGTFFI